ncbi:TPA: DUF6216 family protein [Providencia alcalifaciens]
MNSIFDKIISTVERLIDNDLIFFLVLLVTPILLVFFMIHKVKSGFSISHRLWLILFGNKSEEEGDLLYEIRCLEKFNYHYNTYAVSIRQKKKFESWIKKYELDFKLISKLKKNLDMENLKVKKVHWAIPILLFVFSFVPLTLSLGVSVIAVKPAGLISINDTGWLWINNKEAVEYDFFGVTKNGWVINKDSCKNYLAMELNVEENKENIICKMFEDASYMEYIDILIKKQRWFFGVFGVILIIISILTCREIMYLLITYDVRKMIFKKIKFYRYKR